MKKLILLVAFITILPIGQVASAAGLPPTIWAQGNQNEIGRGRDAGARDGRTDAHDGKSSKPSRWPEYAHGSPLFRQGFLEGYRTGYRDEKRAGHQR